MRESYGGAWLFGLVITFMIIFVGFLAVMISYSITFKTKNEVVGIIEKYEGFVSGNYSGTDDSNPNSIWLINNYLVNSNYSNTGACSCVGTSYCYGSDDLEDYSSLEKAKANTRYFYCIDFVDKGKDDYGRKMGYFNVELFFDFDIPVISNFGTFSVKGQTIKIKNINTEGLAGII